MIKNRLKVIIAERNINQNDLAEQLKISKSTLSNIINERQNATLETAMELTKVLKLKVEDIFYLEEDRDILEKEFLNLIDKLDELYKIYRAEIISKDQLEYLYEDLIKKYYVAYTGEEELFDFVLKHDKEYSSLNAIAQLKIQSCLGDYLYGDDKK